MRLIDKDKLMDDIGMILEENRGSISGWLANLIDKTIEEQPESGTDKYTISSDSGTVQAQPFDWREMDDDL